MLGWRILDKGQHVLNIPVLSKDEEGIVRRIEDRYREATRTIKPETRVETKELIKKLLHETADETGVYFGNRQEEYLAEVSFIHIYGYCFLEELIKNPEIEEISIIGTDKPAYVYLRNKGWQSVNACFDSEKAMADVVNKMARGIGRHITLQNPRLDAMLPDGSRLHASLPPVSCGEITIRKFRENPFSPQELCMNHTITPRALAFLSFVMQSDNSVLIGGNTASGKTTTLNSLFCFVPSNERVIITEETPEINIPHCHQLRMVANKEMGISLKDLVYDSLRMRPDRMIVGEVRNKEETEALFDVLLAGQARGSYATMHARSVAEAVGRLRTFGITATDMESIDCIVIQRRMLCYDPKKRKNTEIRKVVEIAESDGELKTIFSLDERTGRLMERDESALLKRISVGFGMTKTELADDMKKRERMLARACESFSESYLMIQNYLYGGCDGDR